jgi:hypothetical protein
MLVLAGFKNFLDLLFFDFAPVSSASIFFFLEFVVEFPNQV